MVLRIEVHHRVTIDNLELLIAAFGIDPDLIAHATERLRVSSAALAESVSHAGSVATPNP